MKKTTTKCFLFPKGKKNVSSEETNPGLGLQFFEQVISHAPLSASLRPLMSPDL